MALGAVPRLVGGRGSATRRRERSEQAQKLLGRPAEDGVVAGEADRTLEEGGMARHGRDDLGLGLVTHETLGSGLLGPQHVPRLEAQPAEHTADLLLRQRFARVLPVAVLDPLLVQQGDRLAAGASGLRADQLDHDVIGSIWLAWRSPSG